MKNLRNHVSPIELLKKYAGISYILMYTQTGDHIIIPGLINMHAHLGMHLLKGLFEVEQKKWSAYPDSGHEFNGLAPNDSARWIGHDERNKITAVTIRYYRKKISKDIVIWARFLLVMNPLKKVPLYHVVICYLGVTTINDMYFSAPAAERAGEDAGIEVFCGLDLPDFGNGIFLSAGLVCSWVSRF